MPDNGLPPDLPPEYAEAYRRGYERAFAQASAPDDDEIPDDAYEDLFAEPAPEPQDTGVTPVPGPGAHRSPPENERPVWFVPLLLVVLVLVLILGAFALGKLVSSSVGGTDVSTEEPTGDIIPEEPPSKTEKAKPTPEKSPSETPEKEPSDQPYDGRTEAASISGAEGDCQTDDSVDAAGNTVSYSPANVYDDDPTTAWRCDGRGVGRTLTIELAEPTELGAVGLVPGYAKTDPSNGVDRYRENNRLTRVRWTFSDGSSVVQSLDGSPTNRDVQRMPIPPTESDRVVMEILASTPGARNTVAVSEVQLGATTD